MPRGFERDEERRLDTYAYCVSCGAERSDDPIINDMGLTPCPVCGETGVRLHRSRERDSNDQAPA
jgi:predicted RNA-binding Zn-ribbon protein involved in translation (DUF1610 family)